jgi:hypothetical protein
MHPTIVNDPVYRCPRRGTPLFAKPLTLLASALPFDLIEPGLEFVDDRTSQRMRRRSSQQRQRLVMVTLREEVSRVLHCVCGCRSAFLFLATFALASSGFFRCATFGALRL